MGTRRKNRKRNRPLFVLGVIAASIVCMAAVIFTAVKVIKYFQEYFRYASMKGTGIILEEDGFDGLLRWIGEKEEVPENADVAYFQAELRTTGEVYDFTLSLEAFDERNEYMQSFGYVYDSTTGKMTCSADETTVLPTIYDPNAAVDYLDGQICRIPLRAQMKELDFHRFTVEFMKDRRLTPQTAVIDGRGGGEIPVLTWEEYQQGAGGGSDGSSQVVISLTDGTGMTGQRIEYLCRAADKEALTGSPESVMETDYSISGGELKLTDDYGENWISSGLTEQEVQETLDTYGKGQQIPENSFCSDGNGTFAVFYGAQPVLRVLEQDGAESRDIPFHDSFPRMCIARVIKFLDEDNWYAGLGTDWSMGTGGAALVYWTHDGGESWTSYQVPDTNALLLTGLAFTDVENGIMTMEDSFGGASWPHVYVTGDGGMNFREIEISWDAVSEEVSFLNKVDSLTFQDGRYTLVMGQGEYGNQKAEFTSEVLDGEWKFEKSYIGTVHTWG